MIRIAVASGKGGTGKTFVSTNLWKALTDDNQDATLVDCDAEAPDAGIFFPKELSLCLNVTQKIPSIDGNACVYCGKCHEYCSYNAIFILPEFKIIRVMEELCHGCGACFVACNYDAIKEKEVSLGKVSKFITDGGHILTEARMKAGVMSPVQVIKSAIRLSQRAAGIIIYDSPPGTSCPFIHTTAASDYVILVSEPTPFGLSDLKQSAEILLQMKKPFGIIINRSGSGDDKIYKWIGENKIKLLMEIPLRMEIAKTYSEGKLLVTEAPEYRKKFSGLMNKIKEQINFEYERK